MSDLIKTAFARHQAGDLTAAAAAYRAALARDPDDFNALQLLGALLVSSNQAAEALPLLMRAAELAERSPNREQFALVYNNLGNALAALGRPAEAIARYRRSLELAPGNAAAHGNLGSELLAQGDTIAAVAAFEAANNLEPDRADWHTKLASALAATRNIDAAEARYRKALVCDPDFAPALYELGRLLHRYRQRLPEAIALFERLLVVDPAHIEVHRALGNAYRTVYRYDRAIACYRRYLERAPDSSLAYLYLGTCLGEAGQDLESAACLEKAVALDPGSAVAHIELGNALLRLKRPEAGRALYARAAMLQPLITRRAATPEPAFSVLFVMAPGIANTPYDYLIGRGDYDAHFMWFLPEAHQDIAMLRERCDAAMNLIADADQGRDVLPAAAEFLDRLGKPVLNPPVRVLAADRAGVARLAAGIPKCRSARVRRFRGEELAEGPPEGWKPPFLLRAAGLHGGDRFVKIDAPSQVPAFVASDPSADYYAIDYIDYRSADGHFRKYRFIRAGAALLPYHLAIGDQWKLHHFRTDMKQHPRMQEEEAAFLENPDAVFGTAQRAALEAIANAVGLDYMGIDCGLDAAGNVVLFEANAAMLVRGSNVTFPYKDEPVRKIKAAFDQMLAKAARPE